jgi:predicted phosphodiesterase
MRLLHLSDIHFRKGEIATAMDPNFHLRAELVRDAEEFVQRTGQKVDAVIVSGDVAFAGVGEEYEYALEWLDELCRRCGSSLAHVFVVPGNHDVVRKTTRRNVIQVLHRDIKAAGGVSLDGLLRGLLSDPETGPLLYEAIAPYNSFAGRFFCSLLPPERTMARRDLVLNDGSILRLSGINSAFVSSEADEEGSLFFDPASLQITRERGVEHVVVCHHPYTWLRQGNTLRDHLNDVARVHLFGHEHTNRIEVARDWIRVSASAAHPDRTEPGWEPGYNLIDFVIEGTGDTRQLYVGINVRVWQSRPGQFRIKYDRSREVFEQRMELDPWLPATPVEPTSATVTSVVKNTHETSGDDAMDTLRDISICFFQLTFSQKSAIAGKLNLLEEEDINQPDFERFRRVFIRARERGLVAELEREVKAATNH